MHVQYCVIRLEMLSQHNKEIEARRRIVSPAISLVPRREKAKRLGTRLAGHTIRSYGLYERLDVHVDCAGTVWGRD